MFHHLNTPIMIHIAKKVKGKQYARPFVVNSVYFWPSEIKKKHSEFQKPNLIQSSGDMLGKRLNDLGKSGIRTAQAIENLRKALKK